MVLAQEQSIVINPVSSVIKATVLSAFTFLTALAVRDVFLRTLEAVLPEKANEKYFLRIFMNPLLFYLLYFSLTYGKIVHRQHKKT